jgi:hypothetical protein
MSRGKFKPGFDARRHVFTREECRRGYAAAWESLERRFPGCDPHFLLCAIIGSRPWYTLPEVEGITGDEDDTEILRRFVRE